MKRIVGMLLFVTLSYISTNPQGKIVPRTLKDYCNVRDDSSLISFNFTKLSSPPNDLVVEDGKSGDAIRLRLCGPLRRQCDKTDGYRVCLTRGNKEIGMKIPDPVDSRSGKLVFVFHGGTCRRGEAYSVHVIMKCNNEDNYDSRPKMFPHIPGDCNYYIVWETKEACGPEKMVNCTLVGDAGEHYDLSPLMRRSDNYVIPMGDASKSMIILNVCHSVVFGYEVRCQQLSGSCLREITQDQQFKYTNLGDTVNPPKFEKASKALSLTYSMGAMCMKQNPKVLHVETSIEFSCDYRATDTLPVYMGGGEDCLYRLSWKTAAACSVESLRNHSVATAGTCKVTNPLTNIEYNLRDLMNTNYRSNTTDGTEYIFQVCGSVSDGSCPNGAGACFGKNKTSVGTANANLQWSPGGPFLNYTNGAECGKNQRRFTQIAFFCGAEKSASVPIIMENDNCSVIIHWNTPLVCQNRIKCETKNGEISLTSLVKWNENYVVKANDTEFHINVCRPLVPKPYLTCLHGSSACQVIPEENGQFSNETTLGYSRENPFFGDDNNVILRYAEGSPCLEDSNATISTNLTFLCDYRATRGAPRYKYYQNCTHVFEWTTSIVCETAEGRWEKDCAIVNPRLSHKINLSLLSKKPVYSTKSQTSDDYKISICGGDTYCKGSAVCKGDESYGRSSKVIFDYNRNVIKLKFSNGSRCDTGQYSSEVQLTCDESSGIGQPHLILEYSCGVVFEWKTNVVCVNHTFDEPLINAEPNVQEMTENIKEAENGHVSVGTSVGIALLIGCCIALIIYLWSPTRRARLRFFFNSLTTRRDLCRAHYTKVDATEEAALLLDVGETTQCLTDSNSDDELLDA